MQTEQNNSMFVTCIRTHLTFIGFITLCFFSAWFILLELTIID